MRSCVRGLARCPVRPLLHGVLATAGRGLGPLLLGLAGTAAVAQELVPPAESASRPGTTEESPLPEATTPRIHYFRAMTEGTVREMPAAQAPRLSVVEIEPERVPGEVAPRRSRHALNVRSQWPVAALRSLGIQASECTTQYRMPSALRFNGGNVSLNVSAEVRLACRF